LIPERIELSSATTCSTYFSSNQKSPDGSFVQGVGGSSNTVQVTTSLRLKRDDGIKLPIHGSYYGFTDPIALELSVLGRDVLGHFALIVDRPGRVVALVTGQHSYRIVSTGTAS
jgi:hypothetical protein